MRACVDSLYQAILLWYLAWRQGYVRGRMPLMPGQPVALELLVGHRCFSISSGLVPLIIMHSCHLIIPTARPRLSSASPLWGCIPHAQWKFCFLEVHYRLSNRDNAPDYDWSGFDSSSIILAVYVTCCVSFRETPLEVLADASNTGLTFTSIYAIEGNIALKSKVYQFDSKQIPSLSCTSA